MAIAQSAARPVVLVVEDEPILCMSAVDMVDAAGFEPLEASDAAQAVSVLEARQDVRIVFSDINMTRGFDGMQLAALIRDRWPPINIILTSGAMAPTDVIMPTRSMFFAKPYDEKQVVAAMIGFVRDQHH